MSGGERRRDGQSPKFARQSALRWGGPENTSPLPARAHLGAAWGAVRYPWGLTGGLIAGRQRRKYGFKDGPWPIEQPG